MIFSNLTFYNTNTSQFDRWCHISISFIKYVLNIFYLIDSSKLLFSLRYNLIKSFQDENYLLLFVNHINMVRNTSTQWAFSTINRKIKYQMCIVLCICIRYIRLPLLFKLHVSESVWVSICMIINESIKRKRTFHGSTYLEGI